MMPELERIIEVKNTPAGWAQLEEKAERNSSLTMRTAIEGVLDDQQLFCLRYCFVELDRLEHRYGTPTSVVLQIKVGGESDAFRIQDYLAVMTALRRVRLELICGEKVIRGRKRLQYDYYRILPLICVGVKEEPWMAHYLAMVSPGDGAGVRKQVEQSFKEKPLAYQSGGEPVRMLLEWICQQNLWLMQREIAGPDRHPMDEGEKRRLREELLERLREEAPRLGLLARLFWSLFLRSLSDSKDLFYQDRGGSWHIDMETLRCTRLDAVSYAEGVLQLMENACIHSEMQRAYVSIRLSDVDITAKGAERVARAAQTRAEIYRRHRRLWGESVRRTGEAGRKGPVPEYMLDRQTKFCLEFSVLNDSVRDAGQAPGELWGVTRKFASNREKENWEGMTLTDVFSYRCERLGDIAKHYGLRLLEKTVQLNGGFFSVCSPGTPGVQERYSSFYRGEVKQTCYQIPSQEPCTEFNVLLPLYPHWHERKEERESSSPPKRLFERAALTGGAYRQQVLRLRAEAMREGQGPFFEQAEDLLPPRPGPGPDQRRLHGTWGEWFQVKEALINQIWYELYGRMKRTEEKNGEDGEDLWLLDLMHVWDAFSLELLAKAVFYLVAWRWNRKERRVLLALLLPDEMFTSEFIRIFAIFYDKQLSDARWMGENQIALCGYQGEHVEQFPQVHFLLAWETSGSARITARTFAYYNTGPSLDLMPQIRYLTRMEKETSVPQFPFDMFLTAAPEPVRGKTNWFLSRMGRTLEQELWQRPHGCQLKGIRVRLQSNIYLSSFYEAELLFHNVGIIYRFAHLIVRDLLRQLPPRRERPLVVVGYEFYSSVLTEQIAKLLEVSGGAGVHHLIYSTGQEGERLHLSPQLKTMGENAQEAALGKAEYVMILPIGTTMSTLYQIMGEIKARWRDGRFPYEHYVLILVGEDGEKNLSAQYWRPEEPGRVALMPQKNRDPKTCCRYFLEPRTQWNDMHRSVEGSEMEESVLVYVDYTSTRPKEIFVVEDARFRGTSRFLEDQEENGRRLALLKGLIHYGHIVEGNNHFQFFVDMERYFSRAQQKGPDKRRKTVDSWLQSLRGEIDPNAYNIIVSPLHREDSPFAKAVIDQVFEHSLRFLHVDLADTFREDMRAKFSYIADEYREIRQFDRSKPVNVYFVNTAITSGATLARARSLVTMLMEEAGVEYDRESVFKGCFVLVNRSAYDTLNTYVKDPEKHFWAYLHLAVPSFNSRRDRCPTCELAEQYRTLEYSSAGNYLGQEFRRLHVKHKKRTLKEYQDWLAETVMNSGGYAGWLRQWLYSYVREERAGGGRPVGIFTVGKEEYADLRALYRLLQWGVNQFLGKRGIGRDNPPEDGETFMEAVQAFTLNELKCLVRENPEAASAATAGRKRCLEPEYWKQVLIGFVCAQKNYVRMVSIHRAFLKMDTAVDWLEGDIPARGEQTAKFLAELMRETVEGVDTTALKAEWLISYLKVLSRPHLAQYHHIRQGILRLMLQMTAYAIGAADTLPVELSFARPFLRQTGDKGGEMIRGQVLQTLLKRLAGLQSTYFLHRDNMERVVNAFARLRADFLALERDEGWEYQCFNPIPSRNQVERNMIKLVKWTSSCGDDENGCYLIEDSFLSQERGEQDGRETASAVPEHTSGEHPVAGEGAGAPPPGISEGTAE